MNRSGTLLIVEDDDFLREQLKEVFVCDKYTVLTAENGLIALNILRAAAELPDVIFLDVMMPVMDGPTFLYEIQENIENIRFKDIPIVIVSASRLAIKGRYDSFIVKPPQLSKLSSLALKYAGHEGGQGER